MWVGVNLESFSTVPLSVVKKVRALACVGAILGMGATVAVSPVSSAPVAVAWHLDRINQQSLPLDGNVSHGALTGLGVDIYLVDTGIRPTHEQLAGRVVAGIDIPSANGTAVVNPPGSDCDGHGTHVAGLAGGTTTGVATQARIISVRVLDCNGDGEVVDVVEALQWVRGDHVTGVPAVVNLSLGVDLGDDGRAIEEQVTELMNEGVVVTVASGNGDASGKPFDACKIAPGVVPRALTIGAVSVTDTYAYYSNYGACVDLFAPGGDRTRGIDSAWNTSDTSYEFDVGTSMASPLVAGYAALLLQQQPGLCVDAVAAAISGRATVGAISGLDALSPNKLLYLETSMVTATTPGVASNVITSTDAGSLVVTWDAPCDGGSPLTGTTATLLYKGKSVKKATVAANVNGIRFTGLVTGRTYQVVIKSKNALGDGIATSRISTVAVRTLRTGLSIRPELVADIAGDLSLHWSVSSASKKVCALRGTPARLVALHSGTCKVGLRANLGGVAIVRSLRVS